MLVGMFQAEQDYRELRQRIRTLHSVISARRPLFDADMNSDFLRVAVVELRNRKAQIAPLVNAQTQVVARRLRNDPAYDLIGEAQALNALFKPMTDALIAAMPAQPASYDPDTLLPTWPTVPAANLQACRDAIDAFLAEVDFEGT